MKKKTFTLLALFMSCSNSIAAFSTGEPDIEMGDSYEKVLEILKESNRITKTIEGGGIRAEGYSKMTKDCRIKYFIFQGKDGLQRVNFDPAPHLSVENECQ